MRKTATPTILAVFVIALACLLPTVAQATRIVGGFTRIFEGIETASGTDDSSSPTEHVYAVRVSLRNPDINMYASHDNGGLPYETTRQTPQAFLIEHTLKVAVNANFFDITQPTDTDDWGLVICNGTVVSPAAGSPFNSQLLLTAAKAASIVASAWTPSGIDTAVGGAEILVSNGVNVATNPDVDPRTGLGLTADGRYLIIVAADGRSSWGAGVNQHQLADWMLDFGAYDAMCCDGGGSTCLVKSDGAGGYNFIDHPSETRPVGANLGVASVATNAQGPAACSMNANRRDVVYRGNLNHVYLRTWTSTSGWAAPVDLGGITYDSPAIVSRADGHLNVFCRGVDNALYHKYYGNGVWSGWESWGGSIISGPAASFRDANHMDIVARGSDNSVQHIYWANGSPGVWDSLGGGTYDAPGIVSRDSTHINVFCRGTNNQLYQNYWISGNTWSGWSSLGGSLTSGPAACRRDANHINVFFRGSGGDLQQVYWVSGSPWSGVQSLGGGLGGKPACCCPDANGIDVWVRGPQDHWYQRSYASGNWWADFLDMGAMF